jgi:hypothetical protein
MRAWRAKRRQGWDTPPVSWDCHHVHPCPSSLVPAGPQQVLLSPHIIEQCMIHAWEAWVHGVDPRRPRTSPKRGFQHRAENRFPRKIIAALLKWPSEGWGKTRALPRPLVRTPQLLLEAPALEVAPGQQGRGRGWGRGRGQVRSSQHPKSVTPPSSYCAHARVWFVLVMVGILGSCATPRSWHPAITNRIAVLTVSLKPPRCQEAHGSP